MAARRRTLPSMRPRENEAIIRHSSRPRLRSASSCRCSSSCSRARSWASLSSRLGAGAFRSWCPSCCWPSRCGSGCVSTSRRCSRR
jgi:hypothetical protein